MSTQDAIQFIEHQLGYVLPPLQQAIIAGSWEKRNYREIAHQQGYSERYVKDVGSELWRSLSEILGQKVSKPKLKLILENYISFINPVESSPAYDWGKAPEVSFFVGRTQEQECLKKWILNDRCRLICIYGMKGSGKTSLSLKLSQGGIGKTDLALKLAHDLPAEFDIVIWRSLLNSPKPEELVSDWIKRITARSKTPIPELIQDPMDQLLWLLRSQRCLLILDNFESILKAKTKAIKYKTNYHFFGILLELLGKSNHQSCVLITSREKPPEVSRLETPNGKMRSLSLSGLNAKDCQEIFAQIGIFQATKKEWQHLTDFYAGNPLALELAAKHIWEVFHGRISTFLDNQLQLFEDIHDLLDWHFNRLSDQELELAYWFAINREPISIQILAQDILDPSAKQTIASTLQSLQRRLPVEKGHNTFSLQPVLIEYLTTRLIQKWSQELQSQEFLRLHQFAMLKAFTQENIRTAQIDLLVQPVIQISVQFTGGVSAFWDYIKQLISNLKQPTQSNYGYLAGNLINLLTQSGLELTGIDFSKLTIRQAYFQEIPLKNVNLSHSTLINCCFQQYFGDIFSASYSPDGKVVAIADANGYINLVDVSSYQYLLRFQANDTGFWENSILYTPDGQYLVSGGFDNRVKLWQPDTGQLLHIFEGNTGAIWSLQISPDSKIVASAGDDYTIRLWDIQTKECLWILQGHHNSVRSLAFNSNSDLLASGSQDQTVKIWDLRTGECLKTLEHPHWVLSVAFDMDDQTLITIAARSIWLWDIQSEQCIQTLEGHHHFLLAMAFNSQQRQLASSSLDGVIKIWDLDRAECLRTIDKHTDWVFALCFSPNGKVLFSSGYDQTLCFWNISTGDCLSRLQGYCNWVYAVACSPTSPLIASGHKDTHVRIWNVETGDCIQHFQDQKVIHSVAFSPNGETLASGNRESLIRLWDVNTGQCLSILSVGQGGGGIWSLAFSPNGSYLASGSQDGLIRIWDPYTGQLIRCLQEHQHWIWQIAFSPNGKWLASACHDKSAKLWNWQTGECIHTFQDPQDQYMGIAFSPDSRWVAIASQLHGILLWNLQTQSMTCLKGHIGPVMTVAFSPNGKYLASAGCDQRIRLWDFCRRESVSLLQGHRGIIVSMAFSKEERLVSSSNDGTVKVWDVKQQILVQTLQPPRPYEGMKITGIKGLNSSQVNVLELLGASSED